MILPLEEGPVCQICEFKLIRDCFYVTDSPLSVINIAEMAMFYLNWPVLMIFSYREGQLVQLLTVSMIQIVFYMLLT